MPEEMEVLDELQARDLNATSLSTYDFATLNITLPHNLIKDKLIDLIERTFNRKGSPYLACNAQTRFLLRKKLQNIMHVLVKIYVMLLPFCWTIFCAIWHQVC